MGCLIQGRLDFVDLVMYVKENSIRNIVKLQYTTLKRMGLYIHYW